MSNMTRILSAIERGDATTTDELLPLVYEELRVLAAQRLRWETPGQTLEATALVHEAYLRLMGGVPAHWDSQGHFFMAAAEAMRRILVERARRKRRSKHGGQRRRTDLDEAHLSADTSTDTPADDLIALDEALLQLARVDPLKSDLVKLRYFAGLPVEQVAATLGISPTTAKRHWRYARAWLYRQIASCD